jgi:predicted aldo/keto reductase-like oxidoreductase
MRTTIHNGFPVSLLGFGAMRLPRKDDTTDQAATDALVKCALDGGVNYFDTAYAYGVGESERALAHALRASGYPRDAYKVADKMPFWHVKDESSFDEIFYKSLKSLGMDYIDYYLLHAMNQNSLNKAKAMGTIEWINEKKRQGLVRNIGFSIHAPYDVLCQILDANEWDFAQIQYNYLDEDGEPGGQGYRELLRRGIPIIIMEPLRGGMLTGLPEHIAEPFDKLGGSYASYGFRWLAETPGIMTVLSGMNELSQVEENIEIFKDPQPLTDAEHAAVKEVERNILAANKVPCTRCAYCQPCPKEIDIPRIFRVWNERALERNPEPISPELINQAKACIKCRKCERVCPQSIIITDELQRFVKENT